MVTWPVPSWVIDDHGDPATLNARVTDPLNDLSDHTHSGVGGDGSASLTPTRITMGAGVVMQSKGSNVASASPLALPNPLTGNYFSITGTTGFSAITPTVQAGTRILLQFQSGITIVHNATTLILQTGANWAAPAGSVLELVSEGSGNWREVNRWQGVAITDLTPTSITMSGPVLQSKGANIASASALALGTDGNYFIVTGNTSVDSITTKQAGMVIMLRVNTGFTFNHSGSLVLAGSTNWAAPAGAVLTLVSESGAWREVTRMVP